MNKLLLSALAATALLAASASAHAQSAFDGVYVGAGAGFGTGTAEFETNDALADVLGTNVGIALGTKGFHGGFFGGYGLTLSGVYLGVEGAFDVSNIGTEISADAGSVELTRDMSGSVAGRLGYLLSKQTMVYGLAGWNYGRWEVSVDGDDALGHEWVNGVKLGAGVEHDFGGFFGRLGYDVDVSKKEFDEIGVDFKPVTQKATVGVGFRW